MTVMWFYSSSYNPDWAVGYIAYSDVKLPKAPKKLGKKRRYNDSTTPPLDFRSCSESPVWL